MKIDARLLWGKDSKVIYLLIASIIILFTLLGSREIWTQEHRWADIVSGMFFRHDFLHPYLNDVDYYDKPLLSYWLIAGFAFIFGELSTWILRLPSALAGLLAVWSIFRLGTTLKNKELGLLAGWMLLTTFYFIFWARTSSADMLNMAGSLFAVTWYFEKRNKPGLFNYGVFFLILSLTSLCKGLGGMVVPLIAIFPDIISSGNWKKHLRISFFLAMVPAALIYVFPFWASTHWGGDHYGESGLYLVYRENILRYVQPFDHKGPIWTYFVFLPLYLLPWTFFFIPALVSLKNRWKKLSNESKWMSWTLLLLFLFFTLSGSRRNYYVLPLVPFAILLTADWVLAASNELAKRVVWTARFVLVNFIVMFAVFNVVQPLYYAQGGSNQFANELQSKAEKVKPWSSWDVVLLDPESKIRFYLHLSPFVKNYTIAGVRRTGQTEQTLVESWPLLKNKNSQSIYITRKLYAPLIQLLLPNYRMIEARSSLGEKLFKIDNQNASVAFIPPSVNTSS